MISLSVLSTMYVQVPIMATVNGLPYNPTNDPVVLAFLSAGVNPVSGDWHTGSWATAAGVYLAQLLIGPGSGGLPLATGEYRIFVKITDNPEIPVLQPDTLLVT